MKQPQKLRNKNIFKPPPPPPKKKKKTSSIHHHLNLYLDHEYHHMKIRKSHIKSILKNEIRNLPHEIIHR
jgi:hypothetical protein